MRTTGINVSSELCFLNTQICIADDVNYADELCTYKLYRDYWDQNYNAYMANTLPVSIAEVTGWYRAPKIADADLSDEKQYHI